METTLFNTDFENDFVDNEPIMDSIYEIIKISPFEKRLLNTKEMQRLRGIKQLGFASLVYPDAEHSRFSHSIGVCHQSKILMNHVCNNISSKLKYQEWRTDHDKYEPKLLEITEIEKIVISATALLHDLPHSPFSHEIESTESNAIGIPIHDDFVNNHIFYSYLFDCDKSDLAKIIKVYNEAFWGKAKGDPKWGEILTEGENKRRISWNNGYIKMGTETLPILGAMIFEIMLFDKVEYWLEKKDDGEYQTNNNGIEIIINENKDKIKWKMIDGWFRPYRKDIIANTICADLLDYLIRDGRNTGILSSLDLKFLDRITISRAIPEETTTRILLSKIPGFCEHIVFDIYDHKRGVIRQSVITEIVSFLQQRYLLTERVYEHRVVEGARSMLQEAVKLLLEIPDVLKVEMLHTISTIENPPINDEAFFSWVLNLEESKHKNIEKAKQLVRLLRERRIFREIVIIDGVSGENKGSFRGIDVTCRTLEKLIKAEQKDIIDGLNNEIKNYFKKNPNPTIQELINKEIVFTIGVRKYDKRYKIPRVLVALPLMSENNDNKNDNIETLPLFDGKKLPGIKERLESMQYSYKSLWKVYLFIHPYFHSKDFIDLHKKISKIFLEKIIEKGKMQWSNSIEKYEYLFPDQPIDIQSFLEKTRFYVPKDKEYTEKITSLVNKKVKDYGIITIKALEDSFNKNQINQILKDSVLQEKLYDKLNDEKFSFPLPEAARDNNSEDTIIYFIENIIKELKKEKRKNVGKINSDEETTNSIW